VLRSRPNVPYALPPPSSEWILKLEQIDGYALGPLACRDCGCLHNASAECSAELRRAGGLGAIEVLSPMPARRQHCQPISRSASTATDRCQPCESGPLQAPRLTRFRRAASRRRCRDGSAAGYRLCAQRLAWIRHRRCADRRGHVGTIVSVAISIEDLRALAAKARAQAEADGELTPQPGRARWDVPDSIRQAMLEDLESGAYEESARAATAGDQEMTQL
jgi:hypothetical protein